MAETAQQIVNRIYREFKRYTGDGLPNEPTGAPLPVGDPASGVNNPKKVDIREVELAVMSAAAQSATNAEEWAQSDDPISEAAGGDGSSDRSAKYWAEQAGAIAVPDGSVTTPKLADESVSEAKLDAGLALDFRLVDPNGPRIPVQYHSAYKVQILGVEQVAMGGMRGRGGRYKRNRVPVFDMPAFTSQDRHIIDLGDAEGTLIPGATGTTIGDMTANGGLAAAFDGTLSKIFDNSAVEVASGANGNAYVGKNFSSSPKIIKRVRVYPSTDFGFDSTGSASTITLTLWGKNGSAPSSATDGTSLGTWSGSDVLQSRGIVSSDNTTAWDYVWVQLASSAGTARMACAQLEIKEYNPQAGDLFCETEHSLLTWYAQFAAANEGDVTATLGSMPYFCVGSIAGNVVTLNALGEHQRSVIAKSYNIATNELVGSEVMVVSETLDGRANALSYRMTTVTANTQTTITLDDVGSMGPFDRFLVAPVKKGEGPYDHYAYLNTCYIDTGEVRNIADDGRHVQTRGVTNQNVSYDGVISVSVQIPCDGYISPLAVGIEFDHVETISSATTGVGTVRYGMDSSHDVFSNQWRKTLASSESWSMHVVPIAFSGYYGPSLWLYGAGSLNLSATTRQMQIRGWVEP